MLSGPIDLPFYNSLMPLRISFFVGAQHLIGTSLLAYGIPSWLEGAGLSSSSFFSLSTAITRAFYSLTGLSGLANV
ncbi:hypothetical protein DPMN_088591 [Dreissena polymorpha]|uniref:Uncharacterized protein n=1 Tax=Dreissena polymorpha TaxID=45954 RepID=A0A9D4KUT5_DREPO|nr:hypothetical protein DPMN_088591 [Dreissena polymorpha]